MKQSYQDAFQVRWSRTPSGKTRNFGEMFHTSPAFDALHLISQDVARAEYKVYDKQQYKREKDKAKEFQDHPLLALLDDPCPEHKDIDGYILKYITNVYMNVAGEFFWIIERNGQGYPVALYPVLPIWVVQTWSVTYPYFKIMPLGVTSAISVDVPPEDIIWFKNPNMIDPFGRGRGRDEAIGDEIESDEYAAKYQKNLFFNDGQPPMIISMADGTQEQAELLKESWIQKVAGWLNARKPMFTGSKVEVNKLTDSVREMDMVESRKALRDIFNQHYALPPEMRGILENSNRSTIDSADFLYKKNVLSRQVERFVAIINRQLSPQFDKRIELVACNVVPEDTETKKKDALLAFNAGILTENEYRQICGFEPMPDGNVRLRPSSVTMIEQGKGNVPAPIVPVAPKPNPKQPELELVPPKKSKAFTEDVKAKHWTNFDTKAQSVESGFKTAVKEMSTRQRTKFEQSFNGAIRRGLSAQEALDTAITVTFNKKMDAETFNELAPEWAKAVKEGKSLAESLLSTSTSFDLFNPMQAEWVKSHGLEMAENINGTTKEYLAGMKAPIADAVANGDSMDKISNILFEQFDRLSSSRADLIARTETMSSVNFGQFATYKIEGVKKKEWLSTPDKDTRDAHRDVKPRIVDIDEPFTVGGEELMYPGGGEKASNNCNCRCTILPILEGDE